jgi:hypothetical protein
VRAGHSVQGYRVMCGFVRWAGYCVRAGHSVQGHRVNVWSCTVGRILCEGRARIQAL